MSLHKNELKVNVIVYICHVDWFLVSHRLNLIEQALSRGYEVHVVSSGSKYNDFFERKGIYYHNIDLSRNRVSFMELYKATEKIYKILKTVQPDIVHNITAKSILAGSVATIFLPNVKTVINAFSGLGYLFSNNSMKNIVQRSILLTIYFFVFNFSKKYKAIFQNSDDRGFFLKRYIFHLNNTTLIKGSGVNVNLYTPIINQELTLNILFPARLLYDKGIIEFLKAGTELINLHKHIKFLVAGDIDGSNPSCMNKDELMRYLIPNKIEWLGYQGNMLEVFSRVDIVCLPSYREGLPKSLIEAGACGLPVVTCDVEGCREIVKEGYTGFLVRKKSVIDIVEKLDILIKNKDLRTIMGARNRNIVEKEMADTIIVNQTFAFYHNKHENSNIV